MKQEKIVVDCPPGAPSTAELLWGKHVGGHRYEIENVPVWVYGLAYGDIVEADTREDGRKHFKKVLKKSGLLTVRAAGPDADKKVFTRLCETLQRRAVAVERYSVSYVAFAMEPTAFAELEAMIAEAERTGRIYVEIANDEEA